jgi:4'-phosphopantetheinyl transferase
MKTVGNEVCLWITRVSPVTADDYCALSRQEMERSCRLHRKEDRQAFLARRMFVKRAVSAYLGCAMNEISLAHGVSGQPYLMRRDQPILRSFSISSCNGIAAICVGDVAAVGIDIQAIALEAEDVLSRALGPAEVDELFDRPADDVAAAWTACWTRKESYLKARGIGLSVEPRDIRLPRLPDVWAGQCQRLRDAGGQCWSVTSWRVMENFILSLCSSGVSSSARVRRCENLAQGFGAHLQRCPP